MSRIELTGLIGSHPLGALASFGLLRVVSYADASARLCFVERDDWISALDWAKNRVSNVFKAFGDEDVRVTPSTFHEMLGRSLADGTKDLELASFLVALAADGAEDNTKHLMKPSHFYIEVAKPAADRPPLREGVSAIYESTRHEFGRGYAVFRPARRLA